MNTGVYNPISYPGFGPCVFVMQKTAYVVRLILVGSEMCIRDRAVPRAGSCRHPSRSSARGRLKYAGILVAVTPAPGARRDKYVNWSSGQRNQVLSAIKSQRDASANTTAKSRKRNRRRAGYFVPRPGSKLSPGVYMRNGSGVVTVLNILDVTPRYSARLDFTAKALARSRQVFPDQFRIALERALKTAR